MASIEHARRSGNGLAVPPMIGESWDRGPQPWSRRNGDHDGATIPPDAALVLGDAQVTPKPALKTPISADLHSPKPLNNQQSFTSDANKQKSASEVKPTNSRHFYVEPKGADHVY
jgi:hypothetical protein